MGAAAATKTTPAALGGPEGGRLRTSAGRSLRWEALAGAPPVLRCELGHKEPSALAPQDRGPEVSRRPILTALPSQASLSARWEQPNSPSLGSRAGCRVPGRVQGWQTLPEVPLICWTKSLSSPQLSNEARTPAWVGHRGRGWEVRNGVWCPWGSCSHDLRGNKDPPLPPLPDRTGEVPLDLFCPPELAKPWRDPQWSQNWRWGMGW